MSRFTVERLGPDTWEAFAELVERNGGIFGGCWCIGFHAERSQRGIDFREAKRERVFTDRAHAALVFDEHGLAQGWCQYGSVEELSKIKHRVQYEKEPPPVPVWRTACCFWSPVDIAPMADDDDYHYEFGVFDGVDDAVLTHPHPISISTG